MNHALRTELKQLFDDLQQIIQSSDNTAECKMEAQAVVWYYLINPVHTKEKGFFFEESSFPGMHSYAAPVAYVPVLSHVLKTGVLVYKAELERLGQLTDLGYRPDSIITTQQLQTQFVQALAGLFGVDHTDYEPLRTALLKSLLKGVTHERTDL